MKFDLVNLGFMKFTLVIEPKNARIRKRRKHKEEDHIVLILLLVEEDLDFWRSINLFIWVGRLNVMRHDTSMEGT